MAHFIDGPNYEFARRLIELRREKKCTQEELAKAIGVDKRSISMYENGHTFPREDTIKRLALELNTEPDWLANGEIEESRNFQAQLNEKNNSDTSMFLKRIELLYIESWDHIGQEKTITYSASPKYESQCSDLDKFVSISTSPVEQFKAVEYPGALPFNVSYPPGAIIIFDSRKWGIKEIPSGSDVIYRLKAGENTPGLRKLLKEPGVEPILIPADSLHPVTPIKANHLNIEILGVVKTVVIHK